MKRDWKSFAELAGGAAILASLIFVAIELRQNTLATLSTSYQATTDSLNQINLLSVTEPELIRILASGHDSYYDLSREDQIRLGGYRLYPASINLSGSASIILAG